MRNLENGFADLSAVTREGDGEDEVLFGISDGVGFAAVEVDVDVLCHRVCAASEAEGAGILTLVLEMDKTRLHSIPIMC